MKNTLFKIGSILGKIIVGIGSPILVLGGIIYGLLSSPLFYQISVLCKSVDESVKWVLLPGLIVWIVVMLSQFYEIGDDLVRSWKD